MSKIPYPGLEPFAEENAPFFFGRNEQKRAIARSLRVSRLTVLFGESGVGKSSILGAGVIPLFHRDEKFQSVVVLFRDWHGKNPLQDLLETIRDSVNKVMGIQTTALEEQPTPVETLKNWTKILGVEEGKGRLFIILDQFEEYFQYHPQESGESTFANEFPRLVNRSDLRVNFLIALRDDGLAKLYRFQNKILNIFDNQIELKHLNRLAAKDAIVKPIREYNLRQIVADHFQTFELTVLSAGSGMGKSRVLWAIAEELITGSITFRNWRENPVNDLVRKINADLKANFPDISVPKEGISLTETLQWWVQQITKKEKDCQLFIILDQFEEFFQYQDPKKDGGIFMAEFSRAVINPELPVHFLIAIRDEAQDLLKHFKEYIPSIFEHLLQIKPLEENPEISDIVKPIEEGAQHSSKAIDIEPKLVEEVLNQLSTLSQYDLIGKSENRVRKQSNSEKNVKIEAPLLQLVMERLWKEEVNEKKSFCCLHFDTLKDLSIPEKKITGAQRIANDHLREQMQALSSDRERNAMAIVFKYLVSAEGTKTAYPVLNLPEPTGLEPNELLDVLDDLDTKRILRTVKVPSQPEVKQYEIFHDILAWPILNWREKYLQDQKRKEEEEKRKQQAKEEEEKRKKKIWQRIWIGSVVGLLTMTVGIYSLIYEPYRQSQESAEDNRVEAMKIFNSEPRASGQIAGLIRAMQLAKEFSKPFSNPDKLIKDLQKMLTDIHEKNILQVKEVALLDISFSPEENLFATSSHDGYVYLWTSQGKQYAPKIKVSEAPIISLNFSPDGKFLVTVSQDNIFRIWNLQGKQQKEFKLSEAPIRSLDFSFGQKLLATVADDNIVRIWNLQGKQEDEFEVLKASVLRTSFSPDGKVLATVSNDNIVRIWNLQDKQQKAFKVSEAPVTSISFSANGKLLTTISEDNIVRFWTLEGIKHKKEYTIPSPVKPHSISLSPDQKLLAIVSGDGRIHLWDFQKEKEPVESNNLTELLKSSCVWLDDYLDTHPVEQKTLSSICENK